MAKRKDKDKDKDAPRPRKAAGPSRSAASGAADAAPEAPPSAAPPEGVPPPEPSEPAEPTVIYSSEPPSAIITLNRPDRRNAINDEMVTGLHAALDLALDDEGVRAVVLTGTGSAFCSGIDLRQAAETARRSFEEKLADADALARLYRRLRTFEKVTIAAVNGPALASGCGLAILCDFTLATAAARFGFPEVAYGFVPAVVSVYLRGVVTEKRLRDLLLTGRLITADEAAKIGLVSAVVPAGDLIEKCQEIARMIAQNAPGAIRMTKELLETLPGLEIDRALKAAVETSARMMDRTDCLEGVRAFLEKRRPLWSEEPAAPGAEGGAAPDTAG